MIVDEIVKEEHRWSDHPRPAARLGSSPLLPHYAAALRRVAVAGGHCVAALRRVAVAGVYFAAPLRRVAVADATAPCTRLCRLSTTYQQDLC